MRTFVVGVALVGGLTLGGCGAVPAAPADGAAASASASAMRVVTYSGEDLFRGIYFGQGEVAELLPTLWTGCEDERTEAYADASPEAVTAAIEARAAVAAVNGEEEVLALLEAVLAEPIERVGEMPRDGSEAWIDATVDRIADADREFFDSFADDIHSGDHTRIDEALAASRGMLAEITLVDWSNFVLPNPPVLHTWVPESDPDSDLVKVVHLVMPVVVHSVFVANELLEGTLLYQELMVNELASTFGDDDER